MTTVHKIGKVPPAAKEGRYNSEGVAKPDCWQYTVEDLQQIQSVFKLLLDAEPWDAQGMSKEAVHKIKETMLQPFRAQAVAIHQRRIALNVAAVKKACR